jgi:hypothetical protein
LKAVLTASRRASRARSDQNTSAMLPG